MSFAGAALLLFMLSCSFLLNITNDITTDFLAELTVLYTVKVSKVKRTLHQAPANDELMLGLLSGGLTWMRP